MLNLENLVFSSFDSVKKCLCQDLLRGRRGTTVVVDEEGIAFDASFDCYFCFSHAAIGVKATVNRDDGACDKTAGFIRCKEQKRA